MLLSLKSTWRASTSLFSFAKKEFLSTCSYRPEISACLLGLSKRAFSDSSWLPARKFIDHFHECSPLKISVIHNTIFMGCHWNMSWFNPVLIEVMTTLNWPKKSIFQNSSPQPACEQRHDQYLVWKVKIALDQIHCNFAAYKWNFSCDFDNVPNVSQNNSRPQILILWFLLRCLSVKKVMILIWSERCRMTAIGQKYHFCQVLSLMSTRT